MGAWLRLEKRGWNYRNHRNQQMQCENQEDLIPVPKHQYETYPRFRQQYDAQDMIPVSRQLYETQDMIPASRQSQYYSDPPQYFELENEERGRQSIENIARRYDRFEDGHIPALQSSRNDSYSQESGYHYTRPFSTIRPREHEQFPRNETNQIPIRYVGIYLLI